MHYRGAKHPGVTQKRGTFLHQAGSRSLQGQQVQRRHGFTARHACQHPPVHGLRLGPIDQRLVKRISFGGGDGAVARSDRGQFIKRGNVSVVHLCARSAQTLYQGLKSRPRLRFDAVKHQVDGHDKRQQRNVTGLQGLQRLAAQGGVDPGTVLHRVGNGPRYIQGLRKGKNTLLVKAPDGGLVSHQAVESGRHPHRPAGVCAQAHPGHVRCHRHGRAAGRSAWRPVAIVAGAVDGGSEVWVQAQARIGEFAQAHLAYADATAGRKALDRRGVNGGRLRMATRLRAACGRRSGHIKQVFPNHGNAIQRAQWPPRVPARVAGLGFGHCTLFQQAGKQTRFAVPRQCQGVGHHLAGPELPPLVSGMQALDVEGLRTQKFVQCTCTILRIHVLSPSN